MKKGDTMRFRAVMAVLSMVCGVVAVATAPVGAQGPPTCNGRTATIWGDDGNNRIIGTDGPDVIHGMGGRDRIFGGGGADVICGGPGSDLIKGQKGADQLFGDEGRDRVIGGQGKDIIDGGRGNDRVNGGFGDDTITAGPGTDLVQGWAGVDTCDFDRNDQYSLCELGDVAGQNGFGDRTFSVDVPEDFAFATISVDGVGPATAFVFDVQVDIADQVVKDVGIQVLDGFGRAVFAETIALSFMNETFVVAANDPRTVVLTGLGPDDFYSIAFRTQQNLQQLDPATESLFGSGNAVFKWKGGVPNGWSIDLLIASCCEGFVAEGFLAGYARGQQPSLLATFGNVTDVQNIQVAATPGETVYYLDALGADWDLQLLPPG